MTSNDRIVRPAEAEQLTGYCDVHLRRLEARGEFPPRFKLSEAGGPYGAVGWRLSSIQHWIERRAASVGLGRGLAQNLDYPMERGGWPSSTSSLVTSQT